MSQEHSRLNNELSDLTQELRPVVPVHELLFLFYNKYSIMFALTNNWPNKNDPSSQKNPGHSRKFSVKPGVSLFEKSGLNLRFTKEDMKF